MDVIINLANILYVLAYFTSNLLHLRLLALVAGACLAFYFLNQPVPMWNVVAWNCAFCSINLWQLIVLFRARSNRTVQGGR